MNRDRDDIERLLASAGGDPTATARLFELVYDELRGMARARMAQLPPGQTLQATALVHEAYLRVAGDRDRAWEGRAHFFFAAGRAMRDILVEAARRRNAHKRGGDRQRIPLELARVAVELPDDDVLSVDEALEKLQRVNPEGADMVVLRYFAGLGAEDSAQALGMSAATYHRKWRLVWAWLRREMARGLTESGADGD